ncbi:hypothetical protein [Pajaroellobacter abortibovis]|nr:hypothetical protein [Pajaroellobacter abortibovis]
MLHRDLALEQEKIALMKRGIALARQLLDNGSEDLLRKVLVSEEGHVE